MFDKMYPVMLDKDKYSIQSILFGHRIKPKQTLYEYLIEFLIVVMAEKIIAGKEYTDKFPLTDSIIGNRIIYKPVSNIGLKRLIFLENSRIDTRADIDKKAYKKCKELVSEHIDGDSVLSENECLFILQNILYGFSIENTGRSWFVKNLLPVCADVLFPEALGTQKMRKDIHLDNCDESVDKKFEYNSYTYMCRGGEIYYLHLLHALNASPDRKESIENKLTKMIDSMPEISKISKFIQNIWTDEMKIDDSSIIEKTLGAIPDDFSRRDKFTIAELENFLSCSIQPMEKINLFSYGIILQMLRMMFSVADHVENSCTVWVMDISNSTYREHSEILKLCTESFVKNEESIKKYIYNGIEYYYSTNKTQEEKDKMFSDAEKDSYKLFRKLAKNIGILIPLNGGNMRFTLSEEIIKFLVMSLIPATKKVTYDQFLDMMYEHFGMIVSFEHYHR
ncbi:MAG: hypothetical protein K2J39_08800, partial [Ruminococcus sp.]|nr:hypothetical protein [Ruminococcus sp.]